MKPKSKLSKKKSSASKTGKGGPIKTTIRVDSKKKKGGVVELKKEQDVVVICSDDEQEPCDVGRKLKSVKELTAKAIVDEVTRNLKRKALAPLTPPPKMFPKTPTNTKHVNIDMRTPMEYFMFQYKILQSCSIPKEKNTPQLPDSYGFLTFIMKRFLVCATKLIQQVDQNFKLEKWNRSFMTADIKHHPVPVTESKATARYFESVFGRLPGSNLDKDDENEDKQPATSSASTSDNIIENQVEQKDKSMVDNAIKQLDLDIEKNDSLSGQNLINNSEDFDDGFDNLGEGDDDNDQDFTPLNEVSQIENNSSMENSKRVGFPVVSDKIDIEKTAIGALEQIKPKKKKVPTATLR